MFVVSKLWNRWKMWFSFVFRKHRTLGLVPQPSDERDFVYTDETYNSPTVSLREQMSPVRDQYSYQACTAFAASALFEYVAKYKKKVPWNDFAFSEAYLWYWNRFIEGNPDKNVGVFMRNTFKAIYKYGMVTRKDWDFIDGWKTMPDEEARIASAFYLIYLSQFKGYFSIYPGNVKSIKSSLDKGYPVCFGVDVNADFEKLKGKTIIKEMNGKIIGGHAMIITGYGPDGFEIRNSFGKSWGDQGYTIMSEDFIKHNAYDLWTLQ